MSAEKSQPSFSMRVMRTSIGVGLLGALFGAVYADPRYALVYLLFLGWALVNLALWRPFLSEMLQPRRRAGVMFPLGVLKVLWMIVLFILGYYYIGVTEDRKTSNFVAFLLGFNTPFLVALLKVGGQYLTRKSGSVSSQDWPDVLTEPEKRPRPTEE